MPVFRIERRHDGVAVVTWDQPDSSVNTLSPAVVDECERDLLPLLDDGAVRAVVLASGKPNGFIAGADLTMLDGVREASQAEAFSRRGHALLDRIAASPKPVVAAIHGAALGGGLEVALACGFLLASDDPATVLALPEVQLGLLPGGGGTQRLPRRIGLPAALPMLLAGQRVRSRKASRLGLVDAITTPGGIAATAARAALALAASGAASSRRMPRAARWLTFTPLRLVVLRAAHRQVLRRTRGHYPAPLAVLECIRVGLSRGTAAGAELESRRFGELAVSRPARSFLFLFRAGNALRKPRAGAEPHPVRRLAVVGGGFMGTGIASVSLPIGPVVVKDIASEVLSRCARGVNDGLERQLAAGAIGRLERDRRLSRLHLTTDPGELAGADLVIEAVFEDLALKRVVLAEAEATVEPHAVFASNTSALPIAAIAEGARCPERVVGMHYFSPVHQMPLLELVVARRTASWAVDTARAFAVAQGKTVVTVTDSPGFYTTRILAAYLNEAVTLLEEGAAVEEVDRAMRAFGFPVGPLTLLDEVGIDVGAHVARDLAKAFAGRGISSSDALPRLLEAGYLGRKNRRGFYRYPAGRRRGSKRVNREVYGLLGGARRRRLPAAEIANRLGLLMVGEAAACLQEGVIGSPRDGDVAAVLGLGFPPFTGGPFHHVDAEGAVAVVRRLEELAGRHGVRFAPARILADLARGGGRFYG